MTRLDVTTVDQFSAVAALALLFSFAWPLLLRFSSSGVIDPNHVALPSIIASIVGFCAALAAAIGRPKRLWAWVFLVGNSLFLCGAFFVYPLLFMEH